MTIRTQQQGVSLLEMMLVMLVIISLSVSSGYGWQRWHQQQRLLQTVRQTRQFLERVRDDANWHNRNHYLWLAQGERGWCLGSADEEEDMYADTAAHRCDGYASWQFNAPFSEVQVTEMGQKLAFYGMRNSAWPGHITLQSPAGSWKVIISNQGRIRTCLPDGENSC